MNPYGGTEIQLEYLHKYVSKDLLNKVQITTSVPEKDKLVINKSNVLWVHNSYDQPNVQYMRDRKYVDSVDYFIYVSNWQYNKFREQFQIPEYKSFVIKNATHAFDPVEKQKTDKIKILYSSTPWRGLAILVKAIEILNKTRDDFIVDIHSSTKIYGSKFEELEKDKFETLFELCRNTKNVNFKGYTFNGEVRKSLEDTHIYAYPSIFEETSCLAVIEAMSAGCHVVTTNYGALPETCGEFATMIEFDSSASNLIERYAETLNSVLDNYKQNMYKEDLEMQVKYYNKYYSWETRVQEWRNFLNYVRQKTR